MDYILYIISDDLVIGAIVCGIIFALIAWLSISSKTKDWDDDQNTHTPTDKGNLSENDLFSSLYNKTSVYDQVCKDFADMLWFKNGVHKNYEVDTNYLMEPSHIDETLPIRRNKNAEPLSYFPKFYAMSDEQRGRYIDFLSTSELNTDDIGYVFVFYYGLERHLYCGNFDKAFDIILYLREKYDNRSFLTYSATALICSAIKRDRTERLTELFESLDFNKSKYININLLIYGKIKAKYPLNAVDVASHGKDFGFSNQLYIKKCPDLFLETLEKQINDRYYNGIPIQSLDFDEYEEFETFSFYANQSLIFEEMDIPVYTLLSNFAYDIYNLLYETHEIVKAEVRKPERAH